WRNHNGLALMPSVNRSVLELRGQGAVRWITVVRGRDFSAHARAKAQFAPLPRSKFRVADGDAVGVVEDFNLARMTAYHKARLRDGDLEVLCFGGQRNFR